MLAAADIGVTIAMEHRVQCLSFSVSEAMYGSGVNEPTPAGAAGRPNATDSQRPAASQDGLSVGEGSRARSARPNPRMQPTAYRAAG
jgi:hypothetical protein